MSETVQSILGWAIAIGTVAFIAAPFGFVAVMLLTWALS